MTLEEYNQYYNQIPMPDRLPPGAVKLTIDDYTSYSDVLYGKIIIINGYNGRYASIDGSILRPLNPETGKLMGLSCFSI